MLYYGGLDEHRKSHFLNILHCDLRRHMSATKKPRQGLKFAHHLKRDSSLKDGCWKPKEASYKNRRYSLRTGQESQYRVLLTPFFSGKPSIYTMLHPNSMSTPLS